MERNRSFASRFSQSMNAERVLAVSLSPDSSSQYSPLTSMVPPIRRKRPDPSSDPTYGGPLRAAPCPRSAAVITSEESLK